MPGGAEDKVTAFSFVQHGCLAQETHFRGGTLRFQPEVEGTRAGKIRLNGPAIQKNGLPTRSPWPSIEPAPRFSLTCHGTFRIAVLDLATFRIIWAADTKKRIFVPSQAILALLAGSVM